MRLPFIVLGLALLAPVSAVARWDDAEAGQAVLRKPPPPNHEDPTLFGALVDHRGRLYGVSDRFYEFDGVTWSSIPTSNDNIVRAVALDETNRIWYGGINDLGYAEEDTTGARTLHSLRAHLPDPNEPFEVWRTHRHDGRTFFVCNDRVLIWDGSRFTSWSMPAPRRLFSFEFEGAIHVSQPDTGLWRWDGTTFTPIDLRGYEREVVNAAWRDSQGRTVFLAQHSLVRWREGTVESFAEETIRPIRARQISIPALLPDGMIALTTGSGGVAIIDRDGAPVRTIGRDDGLPSLYADQFAPATNGLAWVTGAGGVVLLDTRNRQSNFSTQNGLGGEAHAVIQTPWNEIFAATFEGVGRLVRVPGQAARLERLPFLNGTFWDLTVLPDEKVVATGLGQLLNVTRNQAEPLVERAKVFYRAIPLASNPSKVVAAENDSVVLLDFSRTNPREKTATGFPEHVLRLAVDGDDTIWGSFYRGGVFSLEHIESETPVRRFLKPGADLPDGFDNAHLFVLDGKAYAITPGAIVALPTSPEEKPRVVLPGFGLFSAERTGTGTLWAVATASGREPRLVQLSHDDAGKLDLRITDQIIRDAGHIVSFSRTQDHILWVGGMSGFVRIDAREVADEPAPGAPIIQAVRWREDEAVTRLPLAAAPTVAFARTGTIEFQLRDSNDPFAPVQMIETRLIGRDKGWRLSGMSRSIAGLDEGTHTLEARSVGFLGNPGPVVRYAFTITPPWFRTPLAYAGYALSFITTITLVAQWHTRRIRRQNAQLEQLVNTRTEELAQAVSARSAFLANMGHEIRNPLNGVVGLVDTLRARDLAPEQQAIVGRIGTCADQLISVIDDVLEYARIDAGRIALRTRAFAVREPVEGAIDILRAARPEAVIELRGGGEELDARVIGDPDRIRHILVNYLSNALKFGGGTPVQVGVRRDGPLLVLSVTDHGPGIAPEEQARLFVRFSRGSMAYRHDIPGTGLGLAACKAYAEAMGGDVSVESEPGQGATFFLRLPFRPAVDGAEETTRASRPDLMVGKRALVVDDQDFNRFVLTDLLGRMGATTEQASSIEEARAAFLARAPDIVFVDFDLAGATGADLATWIRKEAPAGRDVPIVATTAFEVDEVRRRCDEAGMDGFLAKPVTAHRLAEVVGRIETIRAGGPAPAAPTAEEPPTPSSFLDILAGGDPDKRREIEHSTWSEVLIEALTAHRALRRDDAALTARHAHRLVSAALILSERELVAAARELNAVAKAGDLAGARLAAGRLRERIRRARRSRRR